MKTWDKRRNKIAIPNEKINRLLSPEFQLKKVADNTNKKTSLSGNGNAKKPFSKKIVPT